MDYGRHRLDYCQFLIGSQINYSQTYLADHSESCDDAINRFVRLEKLTPRTLWENVREEIAASEKGFVLFDVLDKRYSRESRWVRRQWRGNEKRLIYGIGIVTCVYVNPETGRFWIIDFRIYDQGDAQSKINHMLMLDTLLDKKLLFTVLRDSWYASMRIKH